MPKTEHIRDAFVALAVLATLGIAFLIVQSLAQPTWTAGWRYLSVGGLAAIVSIGIGGLAGLVFGLPQSATTAPTPPAGADGADAPRSLADWYSDSSTLERIAGAATAAIIALGLANWNYIAERFDRAALAIGTSMQASVGADLERATIRLANAEAETAALEDGAAGNGAQARVRAARAAAAAAQSDVHRAIDQAEVPGALIMGGYAVLGFAAAYLWTRRFLPHELANARRDQRAVARQDDSDAAELARARTARLEQRVPKDEADASIAREAVAAAKGSEEKAGILASTSIEIVTPGAVQDDPWKGQFGGRTRDGDGEIVASVREMARPRGLFLISLTIRGVDVTAKTRLAGRDVRLYLHPSFPDPIIRPLTLGPDGALDLQLVAIGAFTVGVQILKGEGGADELELDLSGLKDAPAAFRLN